MGFSLLAGFRGRPTCNESVGCMRVCGGLAHHGSQQRFAGQHTGVCCCGLERAQHGVPWSAFDASVFREGDGFVGHIGQRAVEAAIIVRNSLNASSCACYSIATHACACARWCKSAPAACRFVEDVGCWRIVCLEML